MSNLNNFNDLFAPVVQAPVQEKEIIEWRPASKNAPNKQYTAVVRFVPWYQDPTNSIIEKFSAYLENPYQPNTGRTIDSPSSIGEKDPISDTYWALKNSGNAINVENAKKFSRTQKYSMIIQVLQDSVNPKLNGRLLVWRVGKKVYEKIAAEMRPPMAGIQPKNPFDIINGRAFLVKITEVSGFNNYDNCQFVDLDKSQSCLKITEKQEDGTWKIIENVSETSDKQKVFDFLKTNSPDLNKFKYQPWDEDTTKYVDSVIAYYTGRGINGAPAPITQAPSIATPQKTASLESIIGTVGQPSPVNIQSQSIPNQASDPVNPLEGLNLSGEIPMPTEQPSGNISGVDLSNLNSIMGDGVPSLSSMNDNTAGLSTNLDDILAQTLNG